MLSNSHTHARMKARGLGNSYKLATSRCGGLSLDSQWRAQQHTHTKLKLSWILFTSRPAFDNCVYILIKPLDPISPVFLAGSTLEKFEATLSKSVILLSVNWYSISLRDHDKFRAYMCKSTEICDKTQNVLLKIFFRPHLRGQIFLIVCSIYIREIHGCPASIEWYTFSRTTSYFIMANSHPLQTSSI